MEKEIRSILAHTEITKAPAGFTQKLMERIESPHATQNSLLRTWQKWLVGLSFAALIIFSFYSSLAGGQSTEDYPNAYAGWKESVNTAWGTFSDEFQFFLGELDYSRLLYLLILSAICFMAFDLIWHRSLRRSWSA